MTQAKDTCNRVGIHKDKRVQQVVAAVLQQSLGQECPAKLKVREPLVQSESTSKSICQQGTLIEACCFMQPANHQRRRYHKNQAPAQKSFTLENCINNCTIPEVLLLSYIRTSMKKKSKIGNTDLLTMLKRLNISFCNYATTTQPILYNYSTHFLNTSTSILSQPLTKAVLTNQPSILTIN